MTRIMQPNQLFLFLFASILFQSCSHDEFIAPGTPTVQFAFDLEEFSSTDLPAGSSVVLSINKASGEAALTDHAVSIHSYEDGFITEPIPLASNRYFVTEFMVVHDGVALYVTPKRGSRFSDRVDTPLSRDIVMRDDAVLPLQVVAARNAGREILAMRHCGCGSPINGRLWSSPGTTGHWNKARRGLISRHPEYLMACSCSPE